MPLTAYAKTIIWAAYERDETRPLPALDGQQVDLPAARGEAEQTETDGQIDSGEHD